MPKRTDPWMEARQDAFVRYQRTKADNAQTTETTPADSTNGAGPTDSSATTDTSKSDAQSTDTENRPDAAPATQDTETPGGAGTDETAPSAGDETAPDGAAAGADTTPDLDDEMLSSIFDSYGDRLLGTEAAKKRFEETVRTEVQRQTQTLQEAHRVDAEVGALIQQGEGAYQGMLSVLESARAELNKAAQGSETIEFDPNVLNEGVFDQFDNNLRTYGSAIVAEVRGRHNRDLDRAVLGVLDTLPKLSDDQAEELRTMINNARRMERDPRQTAQAFFYALDQLVRFVAQHARTIGAADEHVRTEKRSDVAKKIADANATKAAAAKLSAQRGNLPPETPGDAGTVTGANVEATQAFYEKRKSEGANAAELDRIVAAVARRVALGQPV